MARDSTDQHGLPLWPAPERNKQPIVETLRSVLPEHGKLLEIASGTGQHAVHFAELMPGWTIQPSDREPEHLATLRARVLLRANPRLLAPVELDVTAPPPALAPTAIFCANMIHIAPWAACVGLFDLAARLLPPGGPLITYGPYALHGAHTAESNARFDESLREKNPEWGVRDIDAVAEVARTRGFSLEATHALPANNLLLVWRRTPS